MVSIFTKRLPIVPLLIAGQSICGAAPTESASIGNAGRVYPPLVASAQDDAIELLELLLTTCSSRPKRRQKGTPAQPQAP